jgi:opacity protein-like surface antigen
VTVAAAVLILATLCATVAAAHVPPVAGKLVDCIQQSDLIVAGVIERIANVDALTVETTVHVERTFVGIAPDTRVTFRGGARFAAHERYVVFLRRGETAVIGVQAAGTLFPSRAADDAQYRDVITAVRTALTAEGDTRVERLRSALIPALRAQPEPLRYHAALELGALAHHGALSAAHRDALDAIAADPRTDVKLRRLIALLAQPVGSGQSAVGPRGP